MSENHKSLLERIDRLYEHQLADDPQETTLTQEIAHYTLGNVLGTGGFGVVYLAEDTQLNRKVALKLPHLEGVFSPEKRRRFSAEATTAANLDHPGIVRVYEAHLDGLMPYIASEYCDGPNLADWLSNISALPSWQDCVELVANVADAVDYAHRQGVFHRDLKPANILITRKQPGSLSGQENYADWKLNECDARLTDFGLAKLVDSALTETRSSQMMGTPLYMAPEQIERGSSGNPNSAVDIYSLGVILFETLTGKMPIDGSSYINAMDNIRSLAPGRLADHRSGLPRDLERICSKCLEKNPDARYATAADLAEDLRRCLQGKPVLGKPVGFFSRFAYWCTRPQRVKTVGWYVISWMSLATAWIVFNVVALPIHTEVSNELIWSGLRDLAILIVVGCMPSIWLSWNVLQGREWALWGILVVSVIRIPSLVRAMVATPVYFSMIYGDNTLFSFVDHSMMLIATLIQLFLCVCGILATRKIKQVHLSAAAIGMRD